jgi:purine-binding chemotaxis protein CheW
LPAAGKEAALLSSGSSIIVLHLAYAGEDIIMGILADAVREVMDIDPSHIAAAPSLGRDGASKLIAGIGEKDGCFIVILDIDAAFSEGGDLSSLGEATEEDKAEEARRDSLLAREGR